MKSRKLSSLEKTLLSLYLWPVAIVSTILISAFGLLFVLPLTLVDRKRSGMHQVAVFWARTIIALSFVWHYSCEGRKNLDKKKTYVIVANHQSLLDILVVLAALPPDFRFLAKKELFNIPFLGWQMFQTGYIPIDRGSAQSGRRALMKARRLLEKGVSVLFFPEGTRSLDGKIHEFKNGAFKIAQDLGIEVLPVVIAGTGEAIPKKSKSIQNTSDFRISIGKPVLIPEDEPVDAIKNKLREDMIKRLQGLRTGR